MMAELRNEGIFTPPSTRGTLVYPSNIGGAHWGGVAVDVERRIAVVPVNRIAASVQLIAKPSITIRRAESDRTGAGYEYNGDEGHAVRHAAPPALIRPPACPARRRLSARWSR